MTQVLDKGEVNLLDSMGNDLRIAQAAWVSYAKQDEEKSDEEVAKLIRYLMKHKHGTPFEHVVFQFHVKAPLFVAREWFRHRIGSFNEVSGRYKTFEPEFYIPKQFRVKGSTNKQGSVIPDDAWELENGYETGEFNAGVREILDNSYQFAYNRYKLLLDFGAANELARLAMPLGMYTQWWWTVNLRSLFNFMSLRSAENAQWEIQEYSRAIEEIVKNAVPAAFAAWEENGRVAP